MIKTTRSTTDNTVTKEVTKRKIDEIVTLEGIHKLIYKKTITTFEVIRIYEVVRGENGAEIEKLVSETPEREINREIFEENFVLSEISKKDIATYRMSDIPSFILKTNGKYYHATIKGDINLIGQNKLLMKTHMCGECHRLSAASDENGGCAKVRDYHHSYIEKYDWILEGYETFNVHSPSFVVSKCEHHTPFPPRPVRTTEEINRMKLSLAQFVWDDVQSLAEVRERKYKNR